MRLPTAPIRAQIFFVVFSGHLETVNVPTYNCYKWNFTSKPAPLIDHSEGGMPILSQIDSVFQSIF